MKLMDRLSQPEKEELKNIMLNEPVHPGDTISHHTANALGRKGLANKGPDGWTANWGMIRSGKILGEDSIVPHIA